MRIFLILLVLSLILFAYPVWRLGEWLNISTTANLIVTTPLFLSQFIARWALRHRTGTFAFICRGAADFFLGLSPMILIQVLLAEVALVLFGWPSINVAFFILASTSLVGIWGPTLRLGTRSEITLFELSPAKGTDRVAAITANFYSLSAAARAE